MKNTLHAHAQSTAPRQRSLSLLFNRYYWLQIGLIAFAVVLGISISGEIIKNLLIKTAMEQEADHYWQRYAKDPAAPLPDTKNLYGYRWHVDAPAPPVLQGLALDHGVHRVVIDGKERVTVYTAHDGENLLLVFGESNVKRLIWLFGLAPLMLCLAMLYSVLWLINRRAQRHLSPVTQLAQALLDIDLSQPARNQQPFHRIDTRGNREAAELKLALQRYHQTLIEFIEREQQFTAEVSHELRTPLAVIKGGVELLALKHPDDAVLLRLGAVVQGMQLLIDTLLAIARQDSAPLPLARVNLADTLQHTCTELGERFAQRRMTYALNIVAANTVTVNRCLVEMIFNNLIRNALDYSQGRCIHITVDAQQLIIEDDGVGLSVAAREALLRGENILPQAQSGHGIGLKLVQRLCAMCGWEMTLIDKAGQPAQDTVTGTQGLAVVLRTVARAASV